MPIFLSLILLLAAELPQDFHHFLTWYTTYQGSPYPQDIETAYAAALKTAGLTPTEITTRLETVRKTAATQPPEFIALNFNKIYTMPTPPYRAEPNAFLARIIDGLPPGKALDVAMGQGRNALYLASKGWTVTGYDLSDQGLAQARTAAAKAGLTLETVLASHESFDYGHAHWDLIVETYAFTDLHNETYRRRILDALKPGGLLVIEGFGNPDGDDSMLRAFPGTRVVAYENRPDTADWSLRRMPLERLAVRKQ